MRPENSTPPIPGQTTGLQREFRERLFWYLCLRDWLRDRRIRIHLVSGIEFQMAMFIVGPLLHQIAPVTITAATLLLVFELAITYKLWFQTVKRCCISVR
jgi:hypothetical protein